MISNSIIMKRILENSGAPVAVAVGATVGLTAHDLGVALVAGAGTVAGQLSSDALIAKVHAREKEQIGLALTTASRISSLTPAEMENLADQPLWCRVLAETISGAGKSTYLERVLALGSVLGDTAKASDPIKQQELLAQAVVLRDLEECDVLVLQLLEKGTPPQTSFGGSDEGEDGLLWTWMALDSILNFKGLLQPVLNRLTAQGLVISMSGDKIGTFWASTKFGERVYKRLGEASTLPAEFKMQQGGEAPE